MRVRTGGRSVEIPDERVRGGVAITTTGQGVRVKTEEKAPIELAPAMGWASAGTGVAKAPSPLYPYKSKLEAAFARSLEFDRLAGVIVGFQYEPMNIRLSDGKNFYKPDFLVWSKDNLPTFYEVKGRNRSDERSLVKTKVAASLHPWARFILVKRIRGSWVERDF